MILTLGQLHLCVCRYCFLLQEVLEKMVGLAGKEVGILGEKRL